jgi:O-antigen/teichoic acid export membrane protein
MLAGLAAHGLGLGGTVAIQLFSVPLYLSVWSTAEYGEWLTLSAIPVYLTLADLGIVKTAGTSMTMAVARGSFSEANELFQSAIVFTSLVCGLSGLMIIPGVLYLPLPLQVTDEHRWALALLTSSVLLSIFSGISNAALTATRRYALGELLSNLGRLLEWGGTIVGLILWKSFTAVALGGLCVRLFLTLLQLLIPILDARGLVWGVRLARLDAVRKMVKPAGSFVLLTFTSALSLQGATLLVSYLFDSSSVALFNTYRTFARMPVQLTAIVCHTMEPEFSHLYGNNQYSAIRRSYRRLGLLALFQVCATYSVQYLLAPRLLEIWTKGMVPVNLVYIALFLAAMACASLFCVPRALLVSLNRHHYLAALMLLTVLAGLGGSWFLGKSMGLEGVLISILATEFVGLAVCTYLAKKALR